MSGKNNDGRDSGSDRKHHSHHRRSSSHARHESRSEGNDNDHNDDDNASSRLRHEYLKHKPSLRRAADKSASTDNDRGRQSGDDKGPKHLDIPPLQYAGRKSDRSDKAETAARAERKQENASSAERRVHDPTRTVQELVAAGAFKQAAKDANAGDPGKQSDAVKPAENKQADAAREGDQQLRDVAKNPVRNIEVVYQDQSGDPTRPKREPDFRVKKDGTVEVLKNPDQHNGEKIVVEVERAPGDRNPPSDAQQKAVDDLVTYLAGRYMNDVQKPDGTIGKDGQIQDEQGLVSDSVKQSAKTQPTVQEQLPPEVQDQVERINRWQGSGGGAHGGDGGRFSAGEGREQFAYRDVPRQPDEDDKVAAIKDVASGFFSRGEKEPYHTVRHRGGRGFAVGRYGIDGDQFMSWLMGLSEEQIEKLIKEGKLPKGALDLRKGKNSPEAQKLKGFIDKLKGGQDAPSAAELDQFLPKQLQERIGTDLIQTYAHETANKDANGNLTSVNIGKVVLSMHLGHAATDAEAAKPENQALMQAADRAYPLALRRAMEGDVDIDLSDAAKKIVAVAHGDLGQALWRNHPSDTKYGRLGCAASVSSVLREAGVARVDELSVRQLAKTLKSRGWEPVSFENRQPGDVIIANGYPHGHTGVVGETRNITYNNHSGSKVWSQDPASYWLRNQARGKWPELYCLRPPSR